MSSLIKSAKLTRLCLKNHAVLVTAVRNHWNKDYKPGPYPKTQKEREAAAKKYNIDIAEYKPYPDDGMGYGDYPKFKPVSGDAKDPNYPWDNPELKRNFNEPLHVQFDMIGEDRYDVSARHRIPPWEQWAQFLGCLGVLFIIYYALDDMKMHPAILPKQYPGEGKVHYTFDPKE